jgi:hypothetical protein
MKPSMTQTAANVGGNSQPQHRSREHHAENEFKHKRTEQYRPVGPARFAKQRCEYDQAEAGQ